MSLASLSLDLDNKWSYLKTHGSPEWQHFPSYLDQVVPLALETFADLRATFFIVGQDAELPENRHILTRLGGTNHEIGNHSFHHEPWLHLKSAADIERELKSAHAAIHAATGKEPIGFRGPGFSVSADTLRTLQSLGYGFDASTLPTFIGPLARAYYFRTAKLPADALEQREKLFGSIKDAFRPNKPYLWGLEGPALVEIPVTTVPWIRIPFHVSYLLYISGFSVGAARTYLNTALALCRLGNIDPSILIHPLDFLGNDDVDGLEFFPGMNLDGQSKRRLTAEFLERIATRFEVVPMGEHLKRLRQSPLPERAPKFAA